jgi:hypothetical protein
MDYQIIKKYGQKDKVILLPRDPANRVIKPKSEWTKYDKKLWNSIARARSKILELGLCNEWDYFITLTIDPKKYDRHNLAAYYKDLGEWLYNYRRKTGQKIDYVLIPELHEDGAWHMHGLIKGIPPGKLSLFKIGQHPKKLVDARYLNWEDYARKFGFCSLGEVEDHAAVSHYITKYVTKSLATQSRRLGSKLYYRSQGLKEAEEVIRGKGIIDVVPVELLKSLYVGEYCATGWLN